MSARQRTIAACDKSAAEQFAPWAQGSEDRALKAWRAVESLTPADIAQEWRIADAMIEKLQQLREACHAQ